MAEEGLTETVKGFIEHYVFAVEQLEIMLLLSGAPEAAYTVQEVYDIILSTKPSVQTWLEGMVARGLAVQSQEDPPTFKFAPKDAALQELMKELREAYQAFPVRVIESIYQRARPSLSDPAQTFANAFRLRRD